MYNETLEEQLRIKTNFLSKKLNTECSLGFVEKLGTYVIDLNIIPNVDNFKSISEHINYVLKDIQNYTENKFTFLTFTTNYLDFEFLECVDITTEKYNQRHTNLPLKEKLMGENVTTSLRRHFTYPMDEPSLKLKELLKSRSKISPLEFEFYIENDIYIDISDVVNGSFYSILNEFLDGYDIKYLEEDKIIFSKTLNFGLPIITTGNKISDLLVTRFAIKLLNRINKETSME